MNKSYVTYQLDCMITFLFVVSNVMHVLILHVFVIVIAVHEAR